MDAVYESDLTLVRDKSSVKGYQATFHEFLKSTSSSNKHPTKSGNINVSLDSPAIDQLWDSVNQIIRQVNLQMKLFMENFGVRGKSLSPFCKIFDTKMSLLDEVKKFMTKCNDDANINEGPINDEINNTNGTQLDNVQAIQTLLSKITDEVNNKKESSIIQENNSEGITDTQDNDQHESFYTDGDPSDTFITFKELLTCADIGNMAHICEKMMGSLELGKRESGSTTSEQKVKSLKQRWFTKENNVKNTKLGCEGKHTIYIQRDSLVRLAAKQGKGSNQREEIRYFRVLSLFENITKSGS